MGSSSVRLLSVLQDTRERCTDCGTCLQSCAFLSQYGTPHTIASLFNSHNPQQRQIAYYCSLCGLCTAVCPEGVDPVSLFLTIRRYHAKSGAFDTRPYRSLLRYEALGGSRLFSRYALPAHCETVFFPGCTLSATRPAVTWQIYQQLKKIIPSLGMILACCAKPSHDLGCQEHFQSVFGGLRQRLLTRGVKTVLTACPSCTKIFGEYGEEMSVQTVYQVFQRQKGFTCAPTGQSEEISVHDPCQLRDDPEVQLAVRGLLVNLGYTLVEMPHRGKMTLCCGEGGATGCIESRFSWGWMEKRRQENKTCRLVSYCAGCTARLSRVMPTVHILDLLFRADDTSDSEISVPRGTMSTTINRLLLKLRLAGTSTSLSPAHNHSESE